MNDVQKVVIELKRRAEKYYVTLLSSGKEETERVPLLTKTTLDHAITYIGGMAAKFRVRFPDRHVLHVILQGFGRDIGERQGADMAKKILGI